ncbi:putative disease resistance protein At3g14460 [Carex rostrata]
MAEIVLTPLGWLASPLIKTLFDKAHDHLGTGINKKMKILEATVLPRLSLAIDKVEKSPNREKLVDWLNRLKGVQENASGSENDRDTFSNPPDRVFGRERDKKNIVDLLTDKPLNSEPEPSNRPAIPIIAIMGRSGVGKTALAQYVYKHMDEQKHFDLPVWVHAPRKFKATDVIKIMIEIIEAKKDPPTTDEALLKHTRGMLRSKKLLLVLDDFWSDTEGFQEQWEKFFKFLSSCLPGSKILLTTQSKKAAQQAGLTHYSEVETYNLEEIEEGQFSELFMHHAWPSNFNSQKEEFEEIGRKIAVKLKGDPGAAKLVGHQLSGKLHLRHWEEVAEKDWLGDNLKARIWSYQQLPHDLQCCFAICSLFPKGTFFQREVLIAIWMVEGFIRPTDIQERLEDTGENYLDELVSRFFLEQVVFNERIYYELHDLLHDLAEHVQGDDFIRIDFTNSEQVPSQISPMLCRSENIHHISLPSSMINKLKEKICLMKNICTFCVQFDGGFVPKKVLEDILKNLKKLRVLQLPECGDELPDSVGNLKHLRLLHSYGSRFKLPDRYANLYTSKRFSYKIVNPYPRIFLNLLA